MKVDPQASVAVAWANTGVAGHEIVDVSGSQAITGAIVSCTFIVWNAVEMFPQTSVAVHVLVIEYAPAHALGVVTSAEVNVKEDPHASVAVA